MCACVLCSVFLWHTFDLVHGGELPLPAVVEGVRRDRLEVGRVVSRGGRRAVAALAHARVVAQPPLLEVRVRQRVHHGYSLGRVEY